MSNELNDDPHPELARLRMVVSQALGLTKGGASAHALQLLQDEKQRAEALAAADAEHGPELLHRWERALHLYGTYYDPRNSCAETERQGTSADEAFESS